MQKHSLIDCGWDVGGLGSFWGLYLQTGVVTDFGWDVGVGVIQGLGLQRDACCCPFQKDCYGSFPKLGDTNIDPNIL